jgi:hypothetical protein
MIKFGSRTELTIAKWLDPQIAVRIGQPVHGAADIIAVLGNPIQAQEPDPGQRLQTLLPRETSA